MTVKIKKELNSSICSGLNMPIRMAEASQDRLTTYCSPVPGQKAATLSLQPPRQPEGILKRAPCDIVLVIDVSASMSSAAPLPDLDGSNSESAGLSILDLVKHAARTILETLDKGDRLALVTFSKDANVRYTNLRLPFTDNYRSFISSLRRPAIISVDCRSALKI